MCRRNVSLMVINIIPDKIDKLESNQIFVFGSNTQGRHGKGSALDARKFGAIYGQSFGLQGNTFAIITKDLNKGLRSIPLPQIKSQIDKLWELARHSKHDYLLTPIGTGNAGYSIPEITKLLPKSIPHNIWIPECYAHLKCNLSPKNMMNVMFTGNRIQKFNNASERDDAYAHLEKLIQRAIARGIEWGHNSINFISGMALGVDTAACQFVLDEKLKGHPIEILMTAAIPCLDQDNKWRQDDRIRYRQLLDKCDFVHYVSNLNYTNAGGASCLDKRNKWMASQLTSFHDMAIAIHNGEPGGTQNTINDLVKGDKRVIVYNYRLQQYIKLGSW